MVTGENPKAFVMLCALPPEALVVRFGLGRHDRRSRHSVSAVSGRVRLTGMGPLRAKRAASQLASSLPDGVPVVVMGVGGALVGGFEAGDLVVANALGLAEAPDGGDLEVAHAPAPLDEGSLELAGRLLETLKARFPSTISAPLLSASRTARGGERDRLSDCGAVICDTESAWLSRLGERRPFAVVRSIVDTPERELVSLHTVTGGVKGLHRLAQATEVIAAVLSGCTRPGTRGRAYGRSVSPPSTPPSTVPEERWLSPSSRLLVMRRTEIALVTLVVAAGVLAPVLSAKGPWPIVAYGGLAVLAVAGEVIARRRYRSWGYYERSRDLLVRRGVLVKRLTVVPYGRMQLVDVTAGAAERAFGLSTIKLHTAASATDARIPGLRADEATRLRDQLAALGEAQAAGV